MKDDHKVSKSKTASLKELTVNLSDVSDCVASLRCTELSSAVSVEDATGK